jgi:branched-subunit amino acid transport protein
MQRWLPVAVYTSLRLGVFLASWLLIQAFTPLRGLTALVTALLVSGLVSLFLLNRHRDAMSGVVASAVSRLNARIDRAAAAEDVELRQGQSRAQGDAVDPDGDAGQLQHPDEAGPGRA